MCTNYIKLISDPPTAFAERAEILGGEDCAIELICNVDGKKGRILLVYFCTFWPFFGSYQPTHHLCVLLKHTQKIHQPFLDPSGPILFV